MYELNRHVRELNSPFVVSFMRFATAISNAATGTLVGVAPSTCPTHAQLSALSVGRVTASSSHIILMLSSLSLTLVSASSLFAGCTLAFSFSPDSAALVTVLASGSISIIAQLACINNPFHGGSISNPWQCIPVHSSATFTYNCRDLSLLRCRPLFYLFLACPSVSVANTFPFLGACVGAATKA